MNQIGSQIAAMEKLLDEELPVGLIAEPLYFVEATADARSTAATLKEHAFDECGVRRDGHVKESVRLADLSGGRVGDVAVSVPLERVVAPTTPLWTCIERVAGADALFLLGHCGLHGIVTRADLNKQPARLLMFGIISLLEMLLLALVRLCYRGDDLRSLLAEGRITAAERIYAERRKSDEELDLADCLQLCDKVTICRKLEPLREVWQLSGNNIESLFDTLQGIRDNLAHAQSPTSARTWSQVVEALKRGHALIDPTIEFLDRMPTVTPGSCHSPAVAPKT